jgi:hypothetical protein
MDTMFTVVTDSILSILSIYVSYLWLRLRRFLPVSFRFRYCRL